MTIEVSEDILNQLNVVHYFSEKNINILSMHLVCKEQRFVNNFLMLWSIEDWREIKRFRVAKSSIIKKIILRQWLVAVKNRNNKIK